MNICKECGYRDETIRSHANKIAQLKREKMAYRAALIELSEGNYVSVLQKHMERLDV